MNEHSRWSLDRDPPRDEALARRLREADGLPPAAEPDWERLHTAVMRAVTSGRAPASAREWWVVVAQWRRVAAAAGLAAILGAAALLWGTGLGSSELAVGDDTAPAESVALARVVAAYPDDAVFTSLIQTARTDELISWGDQ